MDNDIVIRLFRHTENGTIVRKLKNRGKGVFGGKIVECPINPTKVGVYSHYWRMKNFEPYIEPLKP